MKKICTAALAALLTTGAAPAATPADAFACNLSYPAAMQAMASLKVLGQKSGTNLLTFTPMTTVTFDAKPVSLFGATPNSLSLELTEPRANSPQSKLRAEFIAVLPRTEAIDDAITNRYQWHLNLCKHLNVCVRAEEVSQSSWFEFGRSAGQLKLLCRYEMTMAELEKLDRSGTL